jgi:hypothetical protein
MISWEDIDSATSRWGIFEAFYFALKIQLLLLILEKRPDSRVSSSS